ncbi:MULTISPECIES: DUF4476 domain-containing protein [unclassified Aureispira]|uniref:DUF4476 domain-containing protein n=1 Tax=unclassified Aureispira TaxID=2649989 RepID=UPI0006979514|nr:MULTISPECIES: DUF4476 domain-containing protein [unclassified Aureispira]WMX16993.1 DUF4476 domain-containing protein [Aureispira sp. CCB-E]
MKNLTLIIALIIGTSFALSAQRGGGTLNSNGNTSSNSTLRGNSNLNRNPNLGTTSRGGSNYGRGGGRPNSGYSNSGRGGNRPNGYGHHNHGHHGHHNNGHHGHHNNSHHVYHNNGHHGHHGHHNNVNVVVTSHHHGHYYNGYCNYTNHNYGWAPVCVADFNIGCRSIRGCGYDNDRLRAAKRFVRCNYVSAHQIADIMLMFSFESTRLAFAKYAFHRTCDIHNYGIVFDQLAFNSSRRELDCYIRDYHW